MFTKFIATITLAVATLAVSAAEVNQASQAELESVKGIGPAMAGKILDERKKAPFKDWADLADRVKGIGTANASKFSEAGLTVGGTSYRGAAALAAGNKPKAESAPARR